MFLCVCVYIINRDVKLEYAGLEIMLNWIRLCSVSSQNQVGPLFSTKCDQNAVTFVLRNRFGYFKV